VFTCRVSRGQASFAVVPSSYSQHQPALKVNPKNNRWLHASGKGASWQRCAILKAHGDGCGSLAVVARADKKRDAAQVEANAANKQHVACDVFVGVNLVGVGLLRAQDDARNDAHRSDSEEYPSSFGLAFGLLQVELLALLLNGQPLAKGEGYHG
jgi:hypothetical protein